MAVRGEGDRFLGLDSSTQGLKAIAIDSGLRVVCDMAANYDADLPEFGTSGGVHRGPDGLTVTAPPLMWAAALDLLFERMTRDGFPFGRVAALSGSGQQHGSVYLRRGARHLLQSLDPARSLREQLHGAFSVDRSPIWMDSSTTRECRELEKALGGAQAVADLTGSRAYERFTGNQIAKVHRTEPERYAQTERIALVSSFMASLLVGDYAPIDVSDGSGMNLMDIRARDWAPAALRATVPDLGHKLGSIVPSHALAGHIHRYFCSRYAFRQECRVIAFSGDNPNSLAGLGLKRAGDVAVSLGTSDTVFAALDEPRPSASEGHIFASPVDPRGYMALICYKNGSLTREDVRERWAGGRWDAFNELLGRTRPGNGGCIGLYIKEPEITPPIMKTGIYTYGPDGRPRELTAAEHARAVVEGQFLSMRLHGGRIGIEPATILATGGASANPSILQIMADVFGVPVYTGSSANSAALGAAFRALHGWRCGEGGWIPFADAMEAAPKAARAAAPDPARQAIYGGMLERYETLERALLADDVAG